MQRCKGVKKVSTKDKPRLAPSFPLAASCQHSLTQDSCAHAARISHCHHNFPKFTLFLCNIWVKLWPVWPRPLFEAALILRQFLVSISAFILILNITPSAGHTTPKCNQGFIIYLGHETMLTHGRLIISIYSRILASWRLPLHYKRLRKNYDDKRYGLYMRAARVFVYRASARLG